MKKKTPRNKARTTLYYLGALEKALTARAAWLLEQGARQDEAIGSALAEVDLLRTALHDRTLPPTMSWE